MEDRFKALLVQESAGAYTATVTDVAIADLPAGEITIKVAYSSVNYKDALSASGNKGVTKKFPHVPGIDAAGTVVSSGAAAFKPGDQVIVTGNDLGMNTWGGFGEYIRVPAAWVVALPDGLSLFEAMCLGTAGLTAGLSVQQIVAAGIKSGKVAVSGASGGVGSIAVAILSRQGYDVLAISGKQDDTFFYNIIGAGSIMSREDFLAAYNSKALAPAVFAAGVDTVGGDILSGMIKSTAYNGVVTCCGNVAAVELNTSIFPFILRGVKLAGIDSVLPATGVKEGIWKLLAGDWKPLHLKEMVKIIGLDELPQALQTIQAGRAKGRFVVKHG
ncbi:YhdH/YhfP family quinone oxidoreductase [Chitinophaga sancti]|uniref:YhdH/YhfP family quinone oxidoreductase n=1 Tax=Chitinophaga sancti TaxID=1004 RepID=UPI003F7AB56F